jgi:hypothetical protein
LPASLEAEPGIRLSCSNGNGWIPDSIADQTGDGPGMTRKRKRARKGWTRAARAP